MNEAYQAAIVEVLINPVADRTFFFNNSWGSYGTNYSNEYFQQTLIRELGGVNANRYPARFYTEWDLGRIRVIPDLVVNLTLRNLDIPRPSTQNYSRNSSRQVSVGKDSSGRDIYQNVYATVNIARSSFTARVEMEVNITDAATRKTVSTNTYREDYSWQEENATYTGDQRALSDQDWNLVNNRRFDEPRKEDVLNELYRRIYPQVKNRIANVVSW
ncbi:MAG: hypothetical protein IPI66_03315 [Chitinophagaceae bacterium]|nr:hypothetical protein [Chitinophagaceae bacterium]